MRISINCNGSYLVEFGELLLAGRKSVGGYAFTFTLRGSRNVSEKPVDVINIGMSISLSNPPRPFIIYVPSAEQMIRCHTSANNSEQVSFEVILTKEQVNALEEYRHEQDLKLNIGLRALTLSNSGLLHSSDFSEASVPREQWLSALKNAGYRQTLLFEVPIPSSTDRLAAPISKAQEFIEIGHYKDAVMQCRHIIERIEELRDDKKESSAANSKAYSNERRDMSSIERLLSLREQLKNVCQLGAHGSEEFTRSQAKAILGMTMTLLAEPTVGFSEFHKENG
jgi:hypothetical protein